MGLAWEKGTILDPHPTARIGLCITRDVIDIKGELLAIGVLHDQVARVEYLVRGLDLKLEHDIQLRIKWRPRAARRDLDHK